MPRQRAFKPKITNIKGLLTEASPLAYPENFFESGDNIELEPTGEVRRRYGLDAEPSYTASTAVLESSFLTYQISEHTWSNVDRNSSLEFRIVREGRYLYFYDNTVTTISGSQKAFTVNLNLFLASGYANADSIAISTDSGYGKLFVVGEGLEPFYISYNQTTDTISTTQVTLFVRDFEDVSDSISVTTEPASNTAAHEYNMRNRGWVSPAQSIADPYAAYFTANSRYPSKNKQWWTGKDASGNFTASILDKFYTGTTSAPKGRYILNAFNKERTTVSGISGLTTVTESTRPTSVAFYAGRVVWGFNNKLFVNKVIQADADIGICYQINDPTSEDVPDLLDDDGVVIPILELSQVLELRALGNYLIVYGSNGLFAISGTDGIFRATGYSVGKIADLRFNAKDSVISFENIQAFWGETAIYVISQDSVAQAPVVQPISIETIDSYYRDIDLYAKQKAIGAYDNVNKRLVWLYTEYSEAPATVEDYTKQLTYDLKLKAFIPTSFPKLTEANRYPAILSVSAIRNPIFVADRYVGLKYLIYTKSGANVQYTFGLLDDTTFYDYKSLDATGKSFDSFIEPGHEQLGDISTKKQSPYIQVFFKRTESAFVLDGSDYEFDKPSSCMLVGKWDWSDSNTSKRWTSPQEVYRFRRPYIPDPLDLTFDYGYSVIDTKTKLRGKGRTLKTRFYSNAGKDFRLLGWNLIIDSNTTP